MLLITNGIYILPNGHELIARRSSDGVYLLHDWRLGPAAAPVYWINEDGRLLSWGRATSWSSNDLHETGRSIDSTLKLDLF